MICAFLLSTDNSSDVPAATIWYTLCVDSSGILLNMTSSHHLTSTDFPMQRIIKTWWPLAASWLLMGIELPALSAVVARLAHPEINLAAYGSVVFPISLIVESPIIMLLAASTALSRDWTSFVKLRRFMMISGLLLTALHVLVAFTPLYYFIVRIMGVEPQVIEPARIGLMIMTPWTWSIAYRRFHQGVLIRFGYSRAVGIGTIIRLVADISVLAIGYSIGTIPGIVVATSAVAAGVISEAIYAGLRVRPVLQNELVSAPRVEPELTFSTFTTFYIPLVMTSLLSLIAQPIGSAAIWNMPHDLESSAVWPVVAGLIFMMRSLGIAYNEVVVALLDEPGAARTLRRFALLLSGGLTGVLLLVVATPLSHFWFQQISGLSPDLADLARAGLWFALPIPAMSVYQSWYQGAILHSRRTRAITEAVVIYLVTIAAMLWFGVASGVWTGLFVGLAAMAISMTLQTAWLWRRSRSILAAHNAGVETALHAAEHAAAK
jgi:hypothetical protein